MQARLIQGWAVTLVWCCLWDPACAGMHAGQVWPAVEGGGSSGRLPPHNFKVLFKEGGMGTFYPMYYALVDKARKMAAAAAQQPLPPPSMEQDKHAVQELVHKA